MLEMIGLTPQEAESLSRNLASHDDFFNEGSMTGAPFLLTLQKNLFRERARGLEEPSSANRFWKMSGAAHSGNSLEISSISLGFKRGLR